MSEVVNLQNPGLKFRKIIGRTYLQEDRLKEAIEIFLGILQDDPEDVDTLLELGNLYLAGGNGRTAANLFRRVLELDPERAVIQKQLALAEREEEDSLPEEPVPTDPAAVARLLQRLTGDLAPFSDKELLRAYQMLQRIMSSPSPGDEIASRLDEIGNIIPALLELNIRQARADGLHTVAESLQQIQVNIAFQKEAHDEPPVKQAPPKAAYRRHFKGKVCLLLPDKKRMSSRMDFVYSTLIQNGCKVIVSEFWEKYEGQPDVVIASNPHLRPALSLEIAASASHGVPVIVDLDMDFENLPIYHPNYISQGLGRQAVSKAYTTSLVLANTVTVPSQVMAAAIEQAGYRAVFAPNGWRRENRSIQHVPRQSNLINFGWLGTSKLIEDLAMVRRIIIRVLHEFDNSRIVIIGNEPAYQLLDGVPQERKVFLPQTGAGDDYALLDQLDLLLVPLRSHPFNQSQPDQILVEAGVRSVPWIASSTPAFKEWGTGGLIAETREDWHTYLRQLILDPELRLSLGKAGVQAAMQREAKFTNRTWISIIEQALSTQNERTVN